MSSRYPKRGEHDLSAKIVCLGCVSVHLRARVIKPNLSVLAWDHESHVSVSSGPIRARIAEIGALVSSNIGREDMALSAVFYEVVLVPASAEIVEIVNVISPVITVQKPSRKCRWCWRYLPCTRSDKEWYCDQCLEKYKKEQNFIRAFHKDNRIKA